MYSSVIVEEGVILIPCALKRVHMLREWLGTVLVCVGSWGMGMPAVVALTVMVPIILGIILTYVRTVRFSAGLKAFGLFLLSKGYSLSLDTNAGIAAM